MKEQIIVKTHEGDFIFNKIGRILSKEDYNSETESRKLRKSEYGWFIDKDPINKAGCYMLFTEKMLEFETPNYIGKTGDIYNRFYTHCCSPEFVESLYEKNENLHIFFCEERDGYKCGDIEAMLIGYKWHAGLWNSF